MCEIFKLKIWRTSLVVIAAIVLVSSAVVFYGLKKEIKISQAGAGHNVMGFAWSENIGWISFNDLNCDVNGDGIYNDGGLNGCPNDNSAVFSYGVNVDLNPASPTFKELSGYAWSENIGWISFEPADVIGCPAGVCQPSLAGGIFSGWARALSHGGGWDGWISLNCANNGGCAVSNYSTSLNGADFKGWAWGGNVAGWISFNSSNTGAVNPYKVYFSNNSPTVIPAAPSIPTNWCASSPGSIKLPWAFSDTEDDPAGIPQTAYRIDLSRSDGDTCTSGKQGSPAVPDTTGSLSGAEINLFPGCANFIDYGNYTYNWSMTVWDSADAQSVTVGGTPFGPTPIHQYPTANFSYSPPLPLIQFQNITFDPLTAPDNSQAYGGASIVSFEWDFEDDGVVNDVTFPPPADPIVIHFYSVEDTFTIDLRVTDSDGFNCWTSQHTPVNTEDITIGENMPEWNETMP